MGLRTAETDSRMFEMTVDGRPVLAAPGETVAAVLIASGYKAFRIDPRTGQPRGLFCGIGVCHECLVTVDGRADVQACQTEARPGMVVLTGLSGPGGRP